ncbi:MAG: apolipoprotein N-acyltransferase [Thermogutta sp.]
MTCFLPSYFGRTGVWRRCRAASLRVTSQPVLFASLGAVFLWAALPPLEIWPLAWIAAIPWLILIDQPGPWSRRHYIQWGIVGFCFWMAALHWLRLPHWATSFGWVALSFYLGWYLPAFIALARIGTRRLRLPLPVVAATVWAGLEVVRAHLLTGFTMASLAHTQYQWVSLLQIADLGGAYAVSWVIMFVTCCLYLSGKRGLQFFFPNRDYEEDLSPHNQATTWLWPTIERRLVAGIAPLIIGAALVLGCSLLYGQWRLSQFNLPRDADSIRVALIQGSQDIRLEDSEEKRERIHRHYLELAFRAARTYADLDLMVWPETVYGGLLIDHDDNPAMPTTWTASDTSPEHFREQVAKACKQSQMLLVQLAENLNSPILLGVETISYTSQGPRIFNSAAYVGYCQTKNMTDRAHDHSSHDTQPLTAKAAIGQRCDPKAKSYCYFGRYDKMHLVMFGEYVPFADIIPALQRMTPLSTSTTPGETPVAFPVKSMLLSPNICYESVIPHLIRRQVLELRATGQEPDVLVNLTNDGWFWGSSELDMHLICGVFRALEMRKPFLIAANTGFSAYIGADGRIYQQGPRRDVAILVADVHRSPLHSPYLDFGVIPNSLLVTFLIVLIFAEFICWVRPVFRKVTSPQSALVS